jgi:CheY-like chemotaxis protein
MATNPSYELPEVVVLEPDYERRTALCNLLMGEGYPIYPVHMFPEGHDALTFLLTHPNRTIVIADYQLTAFAGMTAFAVLKECPQLARCHWFLIVVPRDVILPTEAIKKSLELPVTILQGPAGLTDILHAVKSFTPNLHAHSMN